MAKDTFKILRCSVFTVLKYVWPFFHIMHEKVKSCKTALSNFHDIKQKVLRPVSLISP